MTLARATYCTREDVLSVLGQLQAPRSATAVDRAIESATTSIDGRLHRTFHPTLATKSFPWPDPNSNARSWRLWLDANDLLAVTTLTSGGTTVTDYFLEPQRYGPPYTHIEINQAGQDSWSSGSTNQRAISVTGTWGYTNVARITTALVGSVAFGTSVTVTAGDQIGIGDLLLIDSERMIVTGRRLISTGQTVQTPMTASAASTSLAVVNGTLYFEGEVLTVDTEQMLITAIIGNTLVVERAVNSSVLATHTGSTIYAPRIYDVVRGANGTTAVIHADGSLVSRSVVPAPIRSLAIGEALVELGQGAAGYARTAGSGDNERTIGSGPGLNDLRDQVETSFRRKVRSRVV